LDALQVQCVLEGLSVSADVRLRGGRGTQAKQQVFDEALADAMELGGGTRLFAAAADQFAEGWPLQRQLLALYALKVIVQLKVDAGQQVQAVRPVLWFVGGCTQGDAGCQWLAGGFV